MGVNQSKSDVYKQVEDIIRVDDKHGFISFFASQSEKEKSGDCDTALLEGATGEKEDLVRVDDNLEPAFYVNSLLEKAKSRARKNAVNSSNVVRLICLHGAKDCASVLLEEKTGLKVDLNMALESGFYPLHHAAEYLSSGVTEIFLRHGALTSLPCSVDSSKYNGMLPLNVALEAMCSHEYLSDWTPQKSIFKLIYILCMPQLLEALKTIELLALNTEELPVIASLKAQEGRVVELAALLLVAGDKLLTPVTEDCVDSSIIGQCIHNELLLLIDQEFKLMVTGRSEELSKCRQIKNVMLSAALMLTVFYSAGQTINSYREHLVFWSDLPNYLLARNTICLIKGLGFALKREDLELDDIKCFMAKLDPQESVKLRTSLDQILRSNSSSSEYSQESGIGIQLQPLALKF
ncbi:uncharacterized protein LOC113763842 isoform X2 [Coffea eugenioides]|uniref:uncharacterized protein LOC113763842 isoform X2 n=1 Tax=Coffea eugenioides TaxID=49369 RepID=UPI000F60DD0E|nr:uncharacterized protein LOC113763842 isoform X2 [Coffea eugenioides]